MHSYLHLVDNFTKNININFFFAVQYFIIITDNMSALFNFQSLLSVILLMICTCAYLRSLFPTVMDRNKTGFTGIFWKLARIGERKSPYVAAACITMAISLLFWS